MSRRLAAFVRRIRKRITRWKSRRTVGRWADRNRRRRRRERIERGEPDGYRETVAAVGYELRELYRELASIFSRGDSSGGMLDGARAVVEEVNEAAGAVNGESEQEFAGTFEPEMGLEREVEAGQDASPEQEFDPWAAGEQSASEEDDGFNV